MEEDDGFTVDCTEEELQEFTERLLDADDNNCAGLFRYDLQERRKGCRDVCEEPLFADVDEALFEVPTVAALLALHDNYEPAVDEEEEVTRQERLEEYAFLDAVSETRVMDMTREWMAEKGLLNMDRVQFKRFLHRMWFSLYPRSRR